MSLSLADATLRMGTDYKISGFNGRSHHWQPPKALARNCKLFTSVQLCTPIEFNDLSEEEKTHFYR